MRRTHTDGTQKLKNMSACPRIINTAWESRAGSSGFLDVLEGGAGYREGKAAVWKGAGGRNSLLSEITQRE